MPENELPPMVLTLTWIGAESGDDASVAFPKSMLSNRDELFAVISALLDDHFPSTKGK